MLLANILNLSLPRVIVNNSAVKYVESFKFLGCIINNKLHWNVNINNKLH